MSQAKPSDKEADDYCQAWISNGNDQGKAWRVAYPKSNASDTVMYIKASNMHKMSKIRVRIEQLQVITAQKADEKYGITAESLIKRLGDIDESAEKEGKFSASVSAVMGQAKLCGFDIQKIEVAGPGGKPIQTISATIDPVAAGKAYEDMIKG